MEMGIPKKIHIEERFFVADPSEWQAWQRIPLRAIHPLLSVSIGVHPWLMLLLR